jgi:protein SCO1/2
MRATSLLIVAAISVAFTTPVLAVSPAEYQNIDVVLPTDASVPSGVDVTDAAGHRRGLTDLIEHPSVLVLADYTCRTLCGATVEFVVSALEKSGLRPGDDFQLIVIGLDPRDTRADAANMRKAHIAAGTPLDRATQFLTTDDSIIKILTVALGYRYRYEADSDTYVHPAAAYVLTRDGRVSRVLTGIGLSAADLRLALVEASAGKIGTIRDRIRLLCSAFDPAHGTYNLLVARVLRFAALGTLATLASGIGLLLLADRRRAT